MASEIAAYGFGSHFRSVVSNDIDILLVHQNLTDVSVALAIETKRELLQRLPSCDVVLLSREEEREIEFLKRSDAVLLHSISRETFAADLDLLAAKIHAASKVEEPN